MRLVLDTNVVVSALLWHGTPHRLLAKALEQDIIFCTSGALLAELAGILRRDKFARALAANRTTVDGVLHTYTGFVRVVKASPLAKAVAADPDDDAVLACAIAAKADLIVSGDSGLLGLKGYQGIPIVTSAEALKRLALP